MVNNLSFSKLHFMAVDNFLIANPNLQKVTLINVNLTSESFRFLAGTIAMSTTLRSLDVSQNNLKDSGAV